MVEEIFISEDLGVPPANEIFLRSRFSVPGSLPSGVRFTSVLRSVSLRLHRAGGAPSRQLTLLRTMSYEQTMRDELVLYLPQNHSPSNES